MGSQKYTANFSKKNSYSGQICHFRPENIIVSFRPRKRPIDSILFI